MSLNINDLGLLVVYNARHGTSVKSLCGFVVDDVGKGSAKRIGRTRRQYEKVRRDGVSR
jgi:hypothetical protein